MKPSKPVPGNRQILLFGANGQLGRCLQPRLAGFGNLRAVGHAELDLRDRDGLHALLRATRPDLIVNAAAYTAVDAAETDRDSAQQVNAEAPRIMAQAAREIGALLVHYSTDYVFDGEARTPYPEDAPVRPLGVYGASKLAGEQAVAAAGAPHLILRTAWLYSNHGKNFLNTMLRLAAERDELRVVNDQTGSPTYADLVAATSLAMLERLYADAAPKPELCGLYHLSCAGETTWWGFAQKIMQLAGLSDRVRVTPITTAEYPTAAQRPGYSVLANDRLLRNFGFQLPDWETGLQRCLDERGSAA